MKIIKKAFLAGVGAVSLSRERAKVIADELVKQGKIREQEGRALVDDMLHKASAVKKDLERTINQQVSTAYSKINVVTQEQLKKMERRISELERELGKKSKPAAKAKGSSGNSRTKSK